MKCGYCATVVLVVTLAISAACVKEPNISDLHQNETPKVVPTPKNEKPAVEIISGEDGELTTATITAGRNLQGYDQGGHFDCRRELLPAPVDHAERNKRIEADLERARDFIWGHWQNKKRGYIRLTFDSVDAVTTAHLFIEPDKDGSWQIVRRFVRWHAVMPDRIDDPLIIRRVERKVNRKGHSTLIFKDGNGETQDTL